MCYPFFILLQERFLDKVKLSPDYFIADCEDMLVFYFIKKHIFLCLVNFYKLHRNNVNKITWLEKHQLFDCLL